MGILDIRGITMRNRTASDSCTTILVGRKATCDGSTMIARTEDSQQALT